MKGMRFMLAVICVTAVLLVLIDSRLLGVHKNNCSENRLAQAANSESASAEQRADNPSNAISAHGRKCSNSFVIIIGTILVAISGLSVLLGSFSPMIKFCAAVVTMLAVFGIKIMSRTFFEVPILDVRIGVINSLFTTVMLLSAVETDIFGNLHIPGFQSENLGAFLAYAALAYVYFALYKRTENKIPGAVSVIFQIYAVANIASALRDNIYVIFSALLIFNLFYIFFAKAPAVKTFSYILPTCVGALAVLCFNSKSPEAVVALLLTAVNLTVAYIKNKNRFTAYALNISLMLFGYFVILFGNTFMRPVTALLMFIAYVVCIFAVEKLLLCVYEDRILDVSASIVTLFSLIAACVSGLTQNGVDLHNTCLLCVIGGLVSLLVYFTTGSSEHKLASGVVALSFFIVALLGITAELNANMYVFLIEALCILIAPMLLEKVHFPECLKPLKNGIFYSCGIAGSAIFILSFISEDYYKNFWQYAVCGALFLVICGYNIAFGNRLNAMFKYCAYGIGIILLCSIDAYFPWYPPYSFIGSIWTLPVIVGLTAFLEGGLKKLHDNFSSVFVLTVQITALIIMPQISKFDIVYAVTLAITLAVILAANTLFKNPHYFSLISVGTALAVALLSLRLQPASYTIMVCILAFATALAALRPCKGYKLLSAVCLAIIVCRIGPGIPVYTLAFVWAVIGMYVFSGKRTRTIMKIFCLVFGVSLYYSIAEYLKLTEYTAFTMLGLIAAVLWLEENLLAPAISRSALKETEYISFSVAYLLAVVMYQNAFDAFLFVLIIIMMAAIGFVTGRAAIFITSLCATVVNAFIIFNMYCAPSLWWVSILVIGLALVAVALKNEQNRRKNLPQITAKSIIRKLSSICEDDIDKN